MPGIKLSTSFSPSPFKKYYNGKKGRWNCSKELYDCLYAWQGCSRRFFSSAKACSKLRLRRRYRLVTHKLWWCLLNGSFPPPSPAVTNCRSSRVPPQIFIWRKPGTKSFVELIKSIRSLQRKNNAWISFEGISFLDIYMMKHIQRYAYFSFISLHYKKVQSDMYR